MAGINKKLVASSLLECIVAAVIMLACFVITMDTLTRITLTGNDPLLNVSIEMALRQGYREYEDGEHLPGKYSRDFDWGTMEVELLNYSESIQQLIITAVPTKGIKSVKYNYLVKIKR